jgi:hypothetical protein
VKTLLVLGPPVLFAIHLAAQQPRFDGKTLWHHVEVLAADDMEGRGIGTPGLERAQTYVIDQLKKTGLAPAGMTGFLQPVPLSRRERGDCSAALVRKELVTPLTLGEDAVCTTFLDTAPSVEAPLVFLGYGLKVPEAGYDEFAGLDLRGKVAVTIAGSPPDIDSALLAYYTSRRWDQFREAGLVGWVLMTAPSASWTSLAASATDPRLHLTGDLEETRGEQLMMYVNPARADKLFEGTGHTAAELFELASAHKPLPRFALPVSVRATARIANTLVTAGNVIAKLEGSDPQLKNEYVVVSAHLDHLGVGRPVNGDRIYNGAVDDASGVAALLDIAEVLKREGTRPARSVLFAFFTGEESGHFGSRYFVAHPTVDRKSIVADINIDEIRAIVPPNGVHVLGERESDLGDAAHRVATLQNVAVDVDRQPANRFIDTSDQGSFVLAGIPAVKLNVGFPGELDALLQRYARERHHTPFDDPQQPINLQTIAMYEEFARALVLEVANDPRRPGWKSGSFYERYAK